jgi:hypothetical protein
MLVALTLLGIILLMGGWVFARRKQLEFERLDRESALLALGSEWNVLRGAKAWQLDVRQGAAFVGPDAFLEHVAARRPRLTIEEGPFGDLVAVHLEIDCLPKGSRLVQNGFVRKRP